MLKKGKKPEDSSDYVYEKDSVSEKTAPKPTPSIPSTQTSSENTTIGKNIAIEGHIRGDEHLVIDGAMKGNIEMARHNFSVGSNGRVEGEINAQNVRISGQMIGNIKTQGKVEITKEADFMGDIRAKGISIEDGAYFKGSIELAQEPHRKTTLSAKSTPSTAQQPANKSKNQTAKEVVKEN
ncbi:MAG: polymer-forming cytoskeletal protein [Desulfobacterales bacterium]|nr:polymer-forming cytoskeletal protein [Desulfobacterales bacterium]